MASTPFARAIAYCEQALQSCQYALVWLQQAGVSAPLYLATINEIAAAVVVIQGMVNNLVTLLDNQEAGNVQSPIATVTGISLISVSRTSLYVVPAGKVLVVTGFVVRVTANVASTPAPLVEVIRQSDLAVLVPGSVPAGSQPPSDVVGTNSQYNADTNVAGALLNVSASFPVVAAGDTVQFNVTGGGGGTTLTASVDLFGYLV